MLVSGFGCWRAFLLNHPPSDTGIFDSKVVAGIVPLATGCLVVNVRSISPAAPLRTLMIGGLPGIAGQCHKSVTASAVNWQSVSIWPE